MYKKMKKTKATNTKMLQQLKQSKGITLIALVITIIVLLILAGITISLITGQNSTPEKAAQAKIENDKGAVKDAVSLLVTEKIQDYYDEKYIKNNSDNKYKGTMQTYLESELAESENVTQDGYKIVVAGGKITATKTGESAAFVEGTVSEEGVISWNGQQGVDNIKTTPHTSTTLDMSWSKLKQLANIIAENTSKVDNSTTEVTVNDGTTSYILGVGDTATVYYGKNEPRIDMKVRILGFNHDSTNGETGISFEFEQRLRI